MNYSDLLQQLTVESKDNGTSFLVHTRRNRILDILKDTEYVLIHEGPLSLVYAKRGVDNRAGIQLISSHIDCVYKNCFVESWSEGWKGTFDNSATNAAVIELMLQDKLDSQTLIAFTGDEEHDANGAREVMDFFIREKLIIQYAIILDVTNEGWDDCADFSIENDHGFDILTGYQIVSLLQTAEFPCVFVHDAEPDESWEYRNGVPEILPSIPCLSICLPVHGDMHKEDGVLMRASAISPYQQIITELANANF